MAKTIDDLLREIETLQTKNQELQTRLEETEEMLRAISEGEVDALVVYGDEEERIYTLQGEDYAYRVMVESIHEGAANITTDGTILYCNKHLADMLHRPLETVLGSSFLDYLNLDEQEVFSALTRKGLDGYGKAEINLVCNGGKPIPVLVTASAAEMDKRNRICLVVTDLSEQKQAMARERELQIRLMEQREDERVRIARNLHDGPLQDLLGLSYTLEAMITNPAEPGAPAEADEENPLQAIRESVLKLAGDLRVVCNELRPPSIIRFGLAKAIRYQSDEIHSKNPGLAISLELTEDGQSIPKDISNALFRIFLECMNNVIRHAEASEAKIRLAFGKNSVLMEIQDNGKGFPPPEDWVELARQGHLGLVGMRERAEAIGGKIRISSASCKGTTIQVEVPCANCPPE